jgi:hypothetical protein
MIIHLLKCGVFRATRTVVKRGMIRDVLAER